MYQIFFLISDSITKSVFLFYSLAHFLPLFTLLSVVDSALQVVVLLLLLRHLHRQAVKAIAFGSTGRKDTSGKKRPKSGFGAWMQKDQKLKLPVAQGATQNGRSWTQAERDHKSGRAEVIRVLSLLVAVRYLFARATAVTRDRGL